MAPKNEHLEQDGRAGFSRRDFLKSAGASSLAATVVGVADADAQIATGPRVVGPGEVPVTLTVNGRAGGPLLTWRAPVPIKYSVHVRAVDVTTEEMTS